MSIVESFEILKRDVGKGSSDLLTRQQLDEQLRNTASNNGNQIISFIDSETIKMKGKDYYIWRLYAPVGNVEGVGWVLDQDIDQCMICYEPFSFFQHRHHCRSCGAIVCSTCSPSTVVIEEFAAVGPQRVCHCCYWGQDPVHAGRLRKTGVEKDVSEYALFSERSTPTKNAVSSASASVSASAFAHPKTSPPSAANKLFGSMDSALDVVAKEAEGGISPLRRGSKGPESARKLAAEEARRKRREEFERQQREAQEEFNRQQELLFKLERRVEETGAGAALHSTKQSEAEAEAEAKTSSPGKPTRGSSFGRSGSAVLETLLIVPKPGFVIKTFRVKDNCKVFINILGHKAVSYTNMSQINKYNQRLAHPAELEGFLAFPPYEADEQGESMAYDVLINDTVLSQCLTSTGTETVKPIICEAAIRWISQCFNEEMNGSYKLPKVKAGFKSMLSTPYERRVPAYATAAPSGTAIFKPVAMTRIESGLDSGAPVAARPGSTELPKSRNVSLDRGSMRVSEIDAELFNQFLKPGEMMVASGLVNKPNPMGLPHKRQLILTSGCRLIYVDPSKMEEKGSIEWSAEKMPITKKVWVLCCVVL
mgnify:CR=1 FL=1